MRFSDIELEHLVAKYFCTQITHTPPPAHTHIHAPTHTHTLTQKALMYYTCRQYIGVLTSQIIMTIFIPSLIQLPLFKQSFVENNIYIEWSLGSIDCIYIIYETLGRVYE